MIELRQDNLFEADVEALVNTVNTVGIMGKGIALQFKRSFPENFKAYAKACKKGEVQTGQMFIFDRGELKRPKYIINFPTKKHWRQKSKIEYITEGLEDLVEQVKRLGVKSIAIPALGSSNGGLNWDEVKPLIEQAFTELPEVKTLVYEPWVTPKKIKMATREPKKDLTVPRALFVKLIDLYSVPIQGYALGKLEIQKLAYFLQNAGQDLSLKFEKNMYGPYDVRINHVMLKLEGHYISGFGDQSEASITQISLIPQALEEAEHILNEDREAKARLDRVASLIEGFESPYGMELLATVHWVATQEGAKNAEEAISRIWEWSDRKRENFSRRHILIAWEHLYNEGWLEDQNDFVLA